MKLAVKTFQTKQPAPLPTDKFSQIAQFDLTFVPPDVSSDLFVPFEDFQAANGVGEPLEVVGPLAVGAAIGKVMKSATVVIKFIDAILHVADTPDFSIADMIAYNSELLQDIQGDLDTALQKLDQALEDIGVVSTQINTGLVAEVKAGAFTLFDMIVDFDNPSAAELNQIVNHGSSLVNSALLAAQNASDNGSAVFIASEVVPSLMLAVGARIASADYASNNGLGHSSVQGDINAVDDLLSEIYAPGGILASKIAEETVSETFHVYGTDGNGVVRMAAVNTVKGPGGTIVHTVAADHTYFAGEQLGNDWPQLINMSGSVNGKTGHAALNELATVKVDHVIPFDSDGPSQLVDAIDWMNDQAEQTLDELVEYELDTLGRIDLPDFLNELPLTVGLNEFDAGGSGDDHIVGVEGNGEIDFTAHDLIRGGSGDDTLEGFGGRDSMFGEAGRDLLDGGDGNDKLFGGSSDDHLIGGAGHDKLQGDGGRDLLEGGAGNDVMFQSERGNFFTHMDPDNFDQSAASGGHLYGGGGNDLLVGDNGSDLLDGGTGHDDIYGYGGHDELIGFAGNDLLLAGDGNDTVLAGSGNDFVEGGAGNDLINGGFGDDTITGGGGNDIITGDFGIDTVIYRGDRDDYSLSQACDGTWTVTDTRSNPIDGVDTLLGGTNLSQSSGGYGVEYLQFDDELFELTPVVEGDGPQLAVNGQTQHQEMPMNCGINEITLDTHLDDNGVAPVRQLEIDLSMELDTMPSIVSDELIF
ncbi:MAG: calcium-binding protein [Paracoccaceae bacterium]